MPQMESDYMKKYAYKCLECFAISAHKGDGYSCPSCGGYITPIGHFVEKPGRANIITAGVEVDGLVEMKALMERINELAKQTFNINESPQGKAN